MHDLEKIKIEFENIDLAINDCKDIIVVVHNQYNYIKKCLESVFENTSNFNVYIWDNASDKKTENYLKKISKNKKNIFLHRSEKNLGFIIPNNKMVKKCSSDFIILLNSDTQVLRNWDNVLIGFLKRNKDVSLVGYEGGLLNKDGKGVDVCSGYNADYICGYCMCFSKKTYDQFGLFDEKNIKFAYCEDSDFSLRLRDKNKKIYACYSKDMVLHFGGKTSSNVVDKKLSKKIKNNMNYLKNKWSKFLEKEENKSSFT